MAPGTRNKFGAPMFEPEVFRKQMYCTEVRLTLLGLFGARRLFGAPIVIRRPRNCAPCPPSLRPWLLRAATHLNKSWYTALTRGIREPCPLGGTKFAIRPNFCANLRKNEYENFAGRWFCFRNLPKNIGKFFLNFFNLVRISPPLRTPIALTQKLWQNTSYLQLSGLNNWFYVVTAIFAQRLNICSPKLVE